MTTRVYNDLQLNETCKAVKYKCKIMLAKLVLHSPFFLHTIFLPSFSFHLAMHACAVCDTHIFPDVYKLISTRWNSHIFNFSKMYLKWYCESFLVQLFENLTNTIIYNYTIQCGHHVWKLKCHKIWLEACKMQKKTDKTLPNERYNVRVNMLCIEMIISNV